jgi:hypothetical protein
LEEGGCYSLDNVQIPTLFHEEHSSSSHHELPIPCGLVVDSSIITLVATPRGQRSGDLFEIALLGPSQLKGEADDTLIFLNYSA